MVRKSKNFNYFDSFVRMVDFSCRAAELLTHTLDNFDPHELSVKVREMHTIEHAADMEYHEMQKHLAREFITPIEREDIIRMGQELDEVTDCVEDVLLRMYMYNIQHVPDEAKQMCAIIEKCCRALREAMREFHNFKKSRSINSRIIEVNRLEEDCDRIYIEGNRNLYANCAEPMTVYAWASTFTRLEKCCDACEHVADAMERIIMKNS
ncbi:MAG: DUF47 family protein [Clostridia bacterium]|nr:DUF47 family protein [Clostridia bacterium]